MADFDEFMKQFLTAVKENDSEFLKGVYSEWLKSSGMKEQLDAAGGFDALLGELAYLDAYTFKSSESFDDFFIANLDGPDEQKLVFKKKADSWVVFNEMSNKGLFKTMYSLNYNIEAGKLRILFNGKRSPFVKDTEGQGFNSLINSALVVGDNEITLESIENKELKVDIRISGGAEGGVVDSSQGDAISYQGVVKDPVKLNFKAE